MSEQKKQNLANSSVRKDLLLICLTEKLSENGYRSNGVQGVQTRLKRKDRFESKQSGIIQKLELRFSTLLERGRQLR